MMDLTEGAMARQLVDKFKLCWYRYVAIHVLTLTLWFFSRKKEKKKGFPSPFL